MKNDIVTIKEVTGTSPADPDALPLGAFRLEDVLAIEPPPSDEEIDSKSNEIEDAECRLTDLLTTNHLTKERARQITQSKNMLGINMLAVRGDYDARYVNYLRDNAPKPSRAELDLMLAQEREFEDQERAFGSILAQDQVEIQDQKSKVDSLKGELHRMEVAKNRWQGESVLKKFMEDFRPIAAVARGLRSGWVLDMIGDSILKVGLRLNGNYTKRDLFFSFKFANRDAGMRSVTEEVAEFYRPTDIDSENAE